MTLKWENPVGCATGEVLNCLAWRLDNPKNSTSPIRILDLLRLSHLQRQYGLVGPRAQLIAALHFDGAR